MFKRYVLGILLIGMTGSCLYAQNAISGYVHLEDIIE